MKSFVRFNRDAARIAFERLESRRLLSGTLLDNPGFEAGLTGWQQTGNASAPTFAQIEGARAGLITTRAGAVGAAALEQSLGLAAGSLNNSFGTVVEGSALSQVITVQANTVISFTYKFLSDEVPFSSAKDTAFFSVSGNDATFLANVDDTAATSQFEFRNETAFRTLTFVFSVGGTFTVGVGVVDLNDGFVDSGIVVDGFKLFRVDVNGTAVDEFSSIQVGANVVGAPAPPRTVTVTNLVNDTVVVNPIPPTQGDQGFEIVPGTITSAQLGPGASASFSVRMRTVVEGQFGGQLFVGIDDNVDFDFNITGTVNLPAAPRSNIGIFRNGRFILDTDGNNTFSNTDGQSVYGTSGDLPVIGDWNGDGIDDIGIFRNVVSGNSSFGTFRLDTNGNRAFDNTDRLSSFGLGTDIPIAGDWDGDGDDEIGVFRNGLFILDTNSSGAFENTDARFSYGQAGDIPVVGDWDGDGDDEVGFFRAALSNGVSIGIFRLDSDSNRTFNATDTRYFYGAGTDIPVIGDWNLDGKDDVGLFRNGLFILDNNASGAFENTDTRALYGMTGDRPVTGVWTLPVNAAARLFLNAPIAPAVFSTSTGNHVTNRDLLGASADEVLA